MKMNYLLTASHKLHSTQFPDINAPFRYVRPKHGAHKIIQLEISYTIFRIAEKYLKV